MIKKFFGLIIKIIMDSIFSLMSGFFNSLPVYLLIYILKIDISYKTVFVVSVISVFILIKVFDSWNNNVPFITERMDMIIKQLSSNSEQLNNLNEETKKNTNFISKIGK